MITFLSIIIINWHLILVSFLISKNVGSSISPPTPKKRNEESNDWFLCQLYNFVPNSLWVDVCDFLNRLESYVIERWILRHRSQHL